MKIKQQDGTEIEVFTQEELDERVQAAKDEATKTATDAATKAAQDAADKALEDYKKENEGKTNEEVEKLQKELQEAQEKLDGAGGSGGDDDAQKRRLMQERDDARKNLEQGMADMKKEMEDFKSGMTGDVKNDLLDKYVGKDDAELREKVGLEFDRYRSDEVSKAQMEERMQAAFTIVKGEAPTPAALDGMTSGGQRGDGNPAEGKKHVEVTENAKNIAKALGQDPDEVQAFVDKKANAS